MHPLHRHLEALYARTEGLRRRQADPVAFVHRYREPADQEIAGLVAVSLAYGRVSLFFPVLHAIFDVLDARGGPRRAVEQWDVTRDGPALDGVVYRWNRGDDFTLLFAGLRRTLAREGGLEALFAGGGPLRDRLAHAVDALRQDVLAAARAAGRELHDVSDLSRGLRYLLPSPTTGSACKRWNLYLRWMVRPPLEDVDLGLWTALTPADLVMPVDVHVGRISRMIGLTSRRDASWRTAEAITASLRAFDPHDPIRFDFAIAHLGISEACRGSWETSVCGACPLLGVCREGQPPAGPPA